MVGDAAHPMTPNLSQGTCQALEDAVVLASCLDSATDLCVALHAYQQRRRERTSQIVLITTVTLNAADKSFFNAKGGKIGIWTVAASNAVLDDFGGGTVA
jgi:2-polyprenyl-6-methoxyphenol hydroxylase-like FAD-dependent oxidoreductase